MPFLTKRKITLWRNGIRRESNKRDQLQQHERARVFEVNPTIHAFPSQHREERTFILYAHLVLHHWTLKEKGITRVDINYAITAKCKSLNVTNNAHDAQKPVMQFAFETFKNLFSHFALKSLDNVKQKRR